MNAPVSLCQSKIKKKCSPGMCGNRAGRSTTTTATMGSPVRLSSDKERIQHQYDALAKKTLVGEAKSHRRTLAKRAAREVTFSDLSESELAQLFTTDEYESDYFRFQVSGFDVLVKNELLAEALNALPERKRDIILLSYFLDMSDAEIAELLNVVRTTVFRHRKSALAKIKQYLEGKADDEYR